MSLSSAKKIIRRSWDGIPISDEVITRVNENKSNFFLRIVVANLLKMLKSPEWTNKMKTFRSQEWTQTKVDNIDLPGVDGEQNEPPQPKIADANNDVIEIDDLEIAQPEPNVTKQDLLREVETGPLTGVETLEEPMEIIEYPTVPVQVMQEPAAGTGEIPVSFWSYTKGEVQQ